MRACGLVTAFVLSLWLGFAAPAQAQGGGDWLRAESAHFIVYSRGRENRLIEAAQALEDFDSTLRTLTGVGNAEVHNKLEVYLLRNTNDLRQVFPGAAQEIGGFYTSSPESMAAFVIYSGNGNNFTVTRQQVLFHEYAHHFMLHHFPGAYPKWYIEGWADFLSTTLIRDRQAIVGTPSEARSLEVIVTGLLPPEVFLASERVRLTPQGMSAFYAHSWLAASYIANRPERQRGLLRYVTALGDGEDPVSAFEPAFGVTPAAFDAELRAYTQGATQRLSVRLPAQPPTIAVTRLPAAADDLLLLTARMRLYAPPPDALPAFAARIARLASRHPNDPIAQRALARVAMMSEDYAGARATLEALAAADPNDVESRFLIGASYVIEAVDAEGETQSAAFREARRRFAQGFRANPNHFPTLYFYAATFADSDTPMTQDQLDVLTRAFDLAPQVEEIRLLLALELMEAGQFEPAIDTLRPLMHMPHNDGLAAYVREAMAAARRGEQPPHWGEELVRQKPPGEANAPEEEPEGAPASEDAN